MNRREATIGTRVQVSEGAGLDSGKVGTIITPRLDHRGFPLYVHGAYKPFDRKREVYILTDGGEYIIMFFIYLKKLS